MRDTQGRFTRGHSGNPAGRPKDAEGIATLARRYAVEAVETLARLMRDGDASTSARAAQALLDRGYGKPATTLEGRLDVTRNTTALHLDTLRERLRDVAGGPTGHA